MLCRDFLSFQSFSLVNDLQPSAVTSGLIEQFKRSWLDWNRDSILGVVIRLRAGRGGVVQFPAGEIFLLITKFTVALGPTQPLTKWVFWGNTAAA